jgi:hypothetical protein
MFYGFFEWAACVLNACCFTNLLTISWLYMFIGFLCQGLLSSMSSYITLMFPIKNAKEKATKFRRSI